MVWYTVKTLCIVTCNAIAGLLKSKGMVLKGIELCMRSDIDPGSKEV